MWSRANDDPRGCSCPSNILTSTVRDSSLPLVAQRAFSWLLGREQLVPTPRAHRALPHWASRFIHHAPMFERQTPRAISRRPWWGWVVAESNDSAFVSSASSASTFRLPVSMLSPVLHVLPVYAAGSSVTTVPDNAVWCSRHGRPEHRSRKCRPPILIARRRSAWRAFNRRRTPTFLPLFPSPSASPQFNTCAAV